MVKLNDIILWRREPQVFKGKTNLLLFIEFWCAYLRFRLRGMDKLTILTNFDIPRVVITNSITQPLNKHRNNLG